MNPTTAVGSLAGARGDKYSLPAIVMHWLLALLIVSLLALGWYMTGIPQQTPPRGFYFNLHKSLGVLALIVALAQVAWHFTHAIPPLPAQMAAWEIRASAIGHYVLYAAMILVPLTGYLGSSFNRFGVRFFGIPLPHWGHEDAALRQMFVQAHRVASYTLVVLVVIHVLAALKHRFVDRDEVLQRMAP